MFHARPAGLRRGCRVADPTHGDALINWPAEAPAPSRSTAVLGEDSRGIAPFDGRQFPLRADSLPMDEHRDIVSVAPANALRLNRFSRRACNNYTHYETDYFPLRRSRSAMMQFRNGVQNFCYSPL